MSTKDRSFIPLFQRYQNFTNIGSGSCGHVRIGLLNMRFTVVCNDPLLSEGLQSLLSSLGTIEVGKTDGSLKASVLLARQRLIDAVVVTTDHAKPEELEQIAKLKEEMGIRVIAVSNFDEEPSNFELHLADVLVSRDNGLQGLKRAVSVLDRAIQPFAGAPANNFASLNAAAMRSRSPRQPRLTRREWDVVQQVAQGKSNRQIADELGLREQSVKNLVSGIMRKLNCENRVQLALQFTSEPTKIAG
jgi:DNA-binding NarL/FixJ family response regulator